MGLTKQYLRYSPLDTFNIIASPGCNVTFVVFNGQEGRYLAVGASEDIIIWDMRLGEKAQVISGHKNEVTYLAACPTKTTLAAGYTDGTLKIFDIITGESVTTFTGHRTAITYHTFDKLGHRLASGSKDTEIVVWDVVAECGILRLSGHKGVISQLQFMSEKDVLFSASKDSFIKLWDLVTGHCFRTIAGHLTEVWGISLLREDDYLVAGSSDSELRLWKLSDNCDDTTSKNIKNPIEEEDNIDILCPVYCTKVGSILRNSHGRVVSMVTDNSRQILAVHSNSNNVELFQFLSRNESDLKFKKRLRKARNKAAKCCTESNKETEVENEPALKDIVRRLPAVIKVRGKVKAVNLVLGKGDELRIAVILNNNIIELFSLTISMGLQEEVKSLRKIQSYGHNSEVRCLAFSSDDLAIVSGSGNEVKLWNRSSLSCLRTVQTGYALSVMFVPGDRHVLVGCKEGHLCIVDISAGEVLEEIPAHSSELWSISQLPDSSGVVTGGGDQTVKFWQLELVPDTLTGTKAKILSLLHTRTLKVDDSVLCVKVSSDSKLVAVALLDCTVKIFFLDTFKFFLSLYGHNLPVLCMDISSDCTLIATGSADRNLKIWGLDFGDCHKSLFAHDDSITALSFVPKTHYIFTAGKDGKVKQWDADNFQKIVTLEGHHGEVWNMAISPSGQYVVSCGQDRIIRIYHKTEEPLVLEDEREVEREAEEEQTLATGPDTATPGHINLHLASKKTITAEKAAEVLLECLQVGGQYLMALGENIGDIPPPLPPIMAAFGVNTLDEYLVVVLKNIKANDLEETLLLLPFTAVCELLPLLLKLLEKFVHCELVSRAVIFLLRVHHQQIVANLKLLPLVNKLSSLAINNISNIRDMMGKNLYGLIFLQRDIETKEGVRLFRDATIAKKDSLKKKRKQEKVLQRAVLKI
uniref:Small-subunit processome Utp12 domain-containing protein n=1 Tax=Clastoptera arizonana TaxID=38151 RepID=A0A1B6DL56_9HEMI